MACISAGKIPRSLEIPPSVFILTVRSLLRPFEKARSSGKGARLGFDTWSGRTYMLYKKEVVPAVRKMGAGTCGLADLPMEKR
ncbi:MAG: hypothetical protein K9K62_05355 [Desulfobacteraceae bacterium]|nr:hypothetical protein [Desulfobacteraceae bacterium]